MYHTIFGLTNTKNLPITYLKCHLTECPIFSLATVLGNSLKLSGFAALYCFLSEERDDGITR